MKRLLRHCLFAALLAGLVIGAAACGDEREPLELAPTADSFRILMTSPHNTQFNVPLTSQVVVYTSHDLDPTSVTGRVTLTGPGGFRPSASIEVYDASIIFTPTSNWEELTDYTITVLPGLRGKTGPPLTETKVYTFQTGLRRPKAAQQLSVRAVAPGPDEPCWDFMTFRVFFNEPVDRNTLVFGEAVLFNEVETGKLLPGNLFARAGQLVFDPDEDLVGGKTYRLTITQKLTDAHGTSLAEPYVVDFVAASTGEHVLLAMEKCPTVVPGYSFCEAQPDDASYPLSPIIPRRINSMFTSSVFLGDTDMMIGGRLWNEFGDAKLSPKRIPFVVRKGQRLIGKPLEYKVGGEIASGIFTGEIYVTLLTDAVGEMIGSEFVHGEAGLPATVILTMDAAMSLENPTANALLPQPLLGTKLVGLASVDLIDPEINYEAMKIELIGFAELNLGNERIPVAMALRMVPPPTLPEREFDTEPPEVLSVSPVDMVVEPEDISDIVDVRMAGDKIIAYFSEPLDPDTVRERFYLTGPHGRVAGRYDFYHPKMFFIPAEPMDPDSTYHVVLEPGIEDLVGNATTEKQTFTFRTMGYQSSAEDPPVILSIDPKRGPNSTMPTNFLPEFYFSQIIDTDSLVYGDTYGLYDLTTGELVPGTMVFYSVFLDFVADNQYTVGHHYRWFINDGVTNLDGLALDTDMDRVPGGPEITIDWICTQFSPFSQTVQFTYPYADTNANGYLDEDETPTKTNTMVMESPLIADPAYVMGFFPIYAHEIVTDQEGEPRVGVTVTPYSYQIATSVSVALGGKTDEPGLLDMGRMLIELRPGSRTDIVQSAEGLLEADVDTIMSFNVENSLLNSFLVHDMFMKIPSAVRYSKDGRMMTIIRGSVASGMAIPIVGEMVIPVTVDMISSTVPATRGF
jgi:Bacterial Ig-like domain